jgi:GT2 family glycosyltransferase
VTDAPPLRLVVVTYSPGTSLTAFLSSLATATTWPHEVVLADNGSTDGAPEAAVGPGVRLLHTGGNLGYGTAANLGASGFEGDWLVVANPDVTWSPGSLDVLLEAAERWPRAGCLGPAIRTPDGRLYPSARAFPSLGRVRLVVAGEPVDPFLPRRDRVPGGGHDRLAVRIVHAAAPRGVRRGRRLRSVVLHVLRGHGPVPSTR